MKRIIVTLLACFPFLLPAQLEGEVVYEETIQLKIEIPEIDEEMMARIPQSRSVEKLLYFNKNESLYLDIPSDYDEGEDEMTWNASSPGGEAEIKMVFRSPESRYYMNLNEGTRVEQREFFGKNFLISDELPAYGWKLTGEQKEILEYPCQQATYADEERNIVAWFTSEIPVSSGPDAFGQLPGLILEIDVNDGERDITAKKIQLHELEADTIEQPKKGKKVSQEEFHEIVDAKMKEMEAEHGGSGGRNGTMQVIIRN
jgi:GLPGLI family protein